MHVLTVENTNLRKEITKIPRPQSGLFDPDPET
jgi:hypothetical protein